MAQKGVGDEGTYIIAFIAGTAVRRARAGVPVDQPRLRTNIPDYMRAAIYARWRGRPNRELIVGGAAALGLGFVVMAGAPTLAVAIVGAALGGVGNGVESVAVRTALQEEAETRMRELQTDTEAVWSERRELLDDIHRMSGSLVELANAAAARIQRGESIEMRSSRMVLVADSWLICRLRYLLI